MNADKEHPLIYSCSGASSAAQMANNLAVRIDRLDVAEMSCIAGVGGDVKPLVRTAKSGRPIIALDGCPLHCVAHILKRHGLAADRHYDLARMGVKKKAHVDFDSQEAERILEHILADLRRTDLLPPTESVPEEPAAPREFASPPCYLALFDDDADEANML